MTLKSDWKLSDDACRTATTRVVEEMARLLEAAGMRDVLPLGKARVPVVKCIVPETGTQVRLARALLLLPD